MHRTLETIERIVASSNTATNGNKNTILALGSAVALGRFFHCYEKERESDTAVVLDAKLISFAVYQLSGCFDRVLAENGKSDGKSSSPAVTPPGAIPPSLLHRRTAGYSVSMTSCPTVLLQVLVLTNDRLEGLHPRHQTHQESRMKPASFRCIFVLS
jgi:hypothetical protein